MWYISTCKRSFAKTTKCVRWVGPSLLFFSFFFPLLSFCPWKSSAAVSACCQVRCGVRNNKALNVERGWGQRQHNNPLLSLRSLMCPSWARPSVSSSSFSWRNNDVSTHGGGRRVTNGWGEQRLIQVIAVPFFSFFLFSFFLCQTGERRFIHYVSYESV